MKKQKILVIGASGFLGKALMQTLSKNFDVVGTFHSNPSPGLIQLDLSDSLQFQKTLANTAPDIVVLAAAEANVDSYEKNPAISERQLVSAEIIAEWCEENNSLLVFISTDFVFDGRKGKYGENDSPNPINTYGKNKAEIEKIVQGVEKHLVLRLSTLYGLPLSSEKFVGKAIFKLLKGERVQAAVDWKRSPTLTNDVALALEKLLKNKQYGLFHAAGSTSHSMYDIAIAIAREFNVPLALIEQGKGAELKLPAKRPLDTTLDISKIRKLGIQMSSLENGLGFVHKNMGK